MKTTILTLLLTLAGAVGAEAATGFHTSGSKLLDANGNEFVMRGCNYSYAWQRGHEGSVIPAAKRIGCNAIRIQLSTGAKWPKCTYSDLERLISLCEENKLVAVFNTHDETGSDSVDDLMNAVNYWIEMKDLLNAHASTVIVNISNEWCGKWDSSNWANGYKQAVGKLREAGLTNTLMIDAAGWGQYPRSVSDRGGEVANTDPLSNVMYSVHIYQDAGPTDAKARQAIDYTLNAGVPAVVGEFAYCHQGYDIAYQAVMDYCAEKNVGYMVWSWTGNGSGAEACDMFGSYDDSRWKPNGEKTVRGTNGIQATSKECTVYNQAPSTGGDDNPGGGSFNDGDEVTLLTPNQYFNNWEQEPVNIPAAKFADASEKDELRIYYSANYGAELQLAYVDLNDNWTETVPYKGINGNSFETQKLNSILQHVKKSGFFVKGHGFTFTKATIVKHGTTGIHEAASENVNYPAEIYTLQGNRVKDMQQGVMYIVRQGGKTFKILNR